VIKLTDYIEAFAFDLDGTLIDTAPDLTAASNMMLAILGGRPLSEPRVAALIGGGVEQLVTSVLTLSRDGAAPLQGPVPPASVRAQSPLSGRDRVVASAPTPGRFLVLYH
jgi:phosphoglycolate phosphatase